MCNMKTAARYSQPFTFYSSAVSICLILISFQIPSISASISSSVSQLTSAIKEPVPEESLVHACTSSLDCYNERMEDCRRCYTSSDENRERCKTYLRITYTVLSTIASIFQLSILDQISNILLNTALDVQSPYCVGFSDLMFSGQSVTWVSSTPQLNIGSSAFINSRGTEKLFEAELSNFTIIFQTRFTDAIFNITSEIVYNTTNKEIRKPEPPTQTTYRRLSTAHRLPTHLKLFVQSTNYIRRQIVKLAVRQLTLKPDWSNIYVGDTRKFTIRRKSNLLFIVFIPYHSRFSKEFRRWWLSSLSQSYSDYWKEVYNVFSQCRFK